MNSNLVFAIFMFCVVQQCISVQERCVSCVCGDHESSVCGLEQRMTWIERNMESVDGKLSEWMKQQQQVHHLELQTKQQQKEIDLLRKELEGFKSSHSEELSVAELIIQSEDINTNSSTTANLKQGNTAKELLQNVSLLIQKVDKLESKAFHNLTLEVAVLQEEVQGEKYVRFLMQTNLSETMERLQRLDNSFAKNEKIQEEFAKMEETLEIKLKEWEGLELEFMRQQLQNFRYDSGSDEESLSEILLKFRKKFQNTKEASNNTLYEDKKVLDFCFELISVLNSTIVDQDYLHRKRLSEFENDIALMQVAMKNNFSSCYQILNTLTDSSIISQRDIGNLQMNVKYINQSMSYLANVTLSVRGNGTQARYLKELEDGIQNFFQQIAFQNETLNEEVDSSKEVTFGMFENFRAYIEQSCTSSVSQISNIKDELQENLIFSQNARIERIENDLLELHEELNQLRDFDLNKNLSAIINYQMLQEKQHRDTIERLEEYLISSVKDWQKQTAAPHSLRDFPDSDVDDLFPFPELGEQEENEKDEGEIIEESHCLLPIVKDPLLLIAENISNEFLPLNADEIEAVANGKVLKFGCKDFGTSILTDASTGQQALSNFSLQCLSGQWTGGSFPRCKKLLDESEIIELSKEIDAENFKSRKTVPCFELGERHADPEDCSGYFLCVDGTLLNLQCPDSLLFNAVTSDCEPPINVNCNPRPLFETSIRLKPGNSLDRTFNTDQNIPILTSMEPTVTLQPNRPNRLNSLMSIGPTGELVIYPQSFLTLNCIFPATFSTDSIAPFWLVNGHTPHLSEKSVLVKTSFYKASLTLVSVTANDSGLYTCVAPNGKRNNVQLVVKAVHCPLLTKDSENELTITYRSHPDIGLPIMTSQAVFSCPRGYINTGPSATFCTVYGSWSHLPPFCQKFNLPDMLQEEEMESEKGCLPLDLSKNENLAFEPKEVKSYYVVGDLLLFTCRNSLILSGPITTKCLQSGRWSIDQLPVCVSRS